ISQLGTSFVGARAEPFPRQHVSHGPVGLAHVQDAYDRYQWTLSGGATLLQRPLPLPLRRPRTSRVHIDLREQNGMPMVQSPGLGDSTVYRMGVFNGCLATRPDAGDRSRSRYGDKSRLRICGRGARWIPSAKVYGYALSLVVIDVGMVFIAVLFVIAGRPLWREDHDATYLALALGFSGIPVWGFFEIFCLNGVLFVLFPSICDARPSVGW